MLKNRIARLVFLRYLKSSSKHQHMEDGCMSARCPKGIFSQFLEFRDSAFVVHDMLFPVRTWTTYDDFGNKISMTTYLNVERCRN